MAKNTKKLTDVTGGEISIVFDKLKNKGLIFSYDFSMISKYLLQEFLPIDPYKTDFTSLISSFLEHIEFKENEQFEHLGFFRDAHLREKEELLKATKKESDFHRYICKTYFDLIAEPKDKLLAAYIKATADLKEIDETLDDIKAKLDKITSENITADVQEKKPILYYYQTHNEKARTQILSFIKEGIRDYAISTSYGNSLWGSLMQRISYNYEWNSDSYKPRYPNDLANKLGDLPYPKYVEICKLYDKNKTEFYKFLTKHIVDEEIIFSFNNLIQDHHILDARKEILNETLNIYQAGSKMMFATAVPSIIEGILHDLCILVGEQENNLLREGFQYKLDKLQEYLGIELHYEYYSFRFRLFRNKVSHGRLTKKDVDELADLLLLDLYQICKLVSTDKLNLNHKRFVIHELNQNLAVPDFKYLMQYLLLDNIEIPAFYQLEEQIEEVEKLILNEEFWKFLEEEITHGDDATNHGIHIVIESISRKKLEKEKCKSLFRKLGIKKSDKILANGYLKYLTRDF